MYFGRIPEDKGNDPMEDGVEGSQSQLTKAKRGSDMTPEDFMARLMDALDKAHAAQQDGQQAKRQEEKQQQEKQQQEKQQQREGDSVSKT
ncbi:hypothetical protein ACO1O0_006213 [Amphichorda felina]